jgi:hypothetical protein
MHYKIEPLAAKVKLTGALKFSSYKMVIILTKLKY